MLFLELFAPKGALSEDQRRHLSERLVSEVVSAPGAPDGLIERARAFSQMVVHEPDAFTMSGRLVDSPEAPRYIVRVSVPAGHFTDGMRAEVVARVTRVLAEIDEIPQRLYQEPHAWVHIVEVPDGNLGTFGRVVRLSEILKMVTDPNGTVAEAGLPVDEPTPSTVMDPICGMAVALTDTAITLEHDGTTYAFCSVTCREVFAGQER
jgi:YHS domain-containing protein/phenylpyruvate tautomerase PptA (4-oxalocrotonate tautomerase family)